MDTWGVGDTAVIGINSHLLAISRIATNRYKSPIHVHKYVDNLETFCHNTSANPGFSQTDENGAPTR